MEVGPIQGALTFGVLLGVRHAADADHLAVMLSLVTERASTKSALRSALLWGLGHSLTFLALGLAVVGFGLRLPAELETVLEVLVALTLLALGLPRLLFGRRTLQAQHAVRPLTVGSIHGLSGSAAVSLLVLSTIRSELLGVAFVVLCGLGTLVSMLVITWLLSLCFRASRSVARLESTLVIGAAALSAGLGLVMLAKAIY